MSEAYMGEIKAFGFSFAPRNFAFCNGATLGISQNTALFALLGTYFGGNGQTTFQLPNLGGRLAIGQGQSAGTSQYTIGQVGGNEHTTLTQAQMPIHTHVAQATTNLMADVTGANLTANPAGNFISVGQTGGASPAPMKQFTTAPSPNPPTSAMGVGSAVTTVTNAASGGSQPVSIQAPYLTINYCIATVGIFPSRN